MSSLSTGFVKLQPTGSAVGAVVVDLDVSSPLAARQILALKQGLLDHHILIFKNQDLSEAQLKAFAHYFGSVFLPPADVPVLASKDGGATPDVVLVANVEGGYTGNGELSAHSDHHWAPQPSAGSLLYALEVPQVGGETSFYNMNLAYETLDAETKRRIDSLQLITYNPFLWPKDGPRPTYRVEDKPLISPVFPHPLVRTHPDSGKPILYLDAATEVQVVGLPKQEGAALVAQLREHLEQPHLRYQHRWSVLAYGLLFAIVLVYLLMVVNFQSWVDPLVILTALPGAVAGIVWVLYLTGTSLSVPALMGAIMCVGVATANGVLVVAFANDLRKLAAAEGRQLDATAAALAAGTTRLRPVLMTALAMMVGMLPAALAFGEGAEQNAPLGRAVIGGLLVATAATLFFIPVSYSVLRRPQPKQLKEITA